MSPGVLPRREYHGRVDMTGLRTAIARRAIRIGSIFLAHMGIHRLYATDMPDGPNLHIV